MLKIYLASRYEHREEIQEKWLPAFQRLGVGVTSSWIWIFNDPKTPEPSILDMEDVKRSDGLVILSPRKWFNTGSGGRHTEVGLALAWEKPIILVGERESIFHYHPTVERIEWAEPHEIATRVLGLFRHLDIEKEITDDPLTYLSIPKGEK